MQSFDHKTGHPQVGHGPDLLQSTEMAERDEDNETMLEPVVTLEGDLLEHRDEDEGNEGDDDDKYLDRLGPNSRGPMHPPPERSKFWRYNRQLLDQGKLAEEWARRLEHHALLLVERLFEYLAGIQLDVSAPQGISLPASAIAWLASQIYPTHCDSGRNAYGRQKEPFCMGASMRDRITLLKYLLPRCTHLRVTSDKWPPPIKREKRKEGYDAPSFEGNDIAFSDLSVHSALTMETWTAAPTSIQSFLSYYHGIQNRPRADLRIFSSLKVLFLDKIAPEWIVNLPAGLQLLRVDRSGMFNLTQFLLPTSPEPGYNVRSMKMLTHLRMSHCAIGELSGLRGRRAMPASGSDTLATHIVGIPPPLSRFPNLVSVCLSNNELRTVRSAFAGLSSLSMLSRINLSFNFLTSLKGCNAMVGNIKELVLTGNCLTTVKGIDKCYSLEILYLDSNSFQDVADVATLANLPELTMLYLHDNPLVDNDPKGYRVRIFDLFKESRFGSLLPNATYRQLLQILPALDGEPASKKELVGLRGLTFTQSVVQNTPEMQVKPTVLSIKDNQFAGEAPMPSLLSVAKPRRVLRSGKRRRARVDDDPPMNSLNYKHTEGVLTLPPLQFSVQDIIASFSACDEIVDLSRSEISADDGLVSAIKVILAEESTEDSVYATSEQAEKQPGDNLFSDAVKSPPTSPNKTRKRPTVTSHQGEMSFLSLSPIKAVDESHDVDTPPDDVISVGNIRNELQLTVTNDAIEHVGIKETTSRSSTNPFSSSFKTPKDELPECEELMDILPQTMVTFPEHVWGGNHDALSIASSLGTNTLDFPEENKYYTAEKNSFYDGPDLYKHLSVATNLELYFKSFVFNLSHDDERNRSFAGSLSDEDMSKMILETAPRIQLRPLDRKTAESLMMDRSVGIKSLTMHETFVRIWKENVIACGKSATRRVSPHRTPRRSFHGDSLFSNGKLEKVCDTRTLILCSSNAAIYLIPAFDQSTSDIKKKNDKRGFPSPIPQEALFQNSQWPHALARHPIHTLHRITIGFGFQRLTLHFGPGSAFEQTVMGNEYAYVLTTCNKMRTVELLQQLQEQKREESTKASTLLATKMTIDNDDKQVLDALSAAVAPSVVGVILHYQILYQRWKHGDRGVVRRVCVVTDQQLFLLDEDYVGDGSESFEPGARTFGEVLFRVVDSADLNQVSQIQAAGFDPKAITIVIRPKSRLQRTRNWRLNCHHAEGAERLVEDVRKAVACG